jgi:hypothetical protein
MKTFVMVVGTPFILIGHLIGFIFSKVFIGFLHGMEAGGIHIGEIINDKFGLRLY